MISIFKQRLSFGVFLRAIILLFSFVFYACQVALAQNQETNSITQPNQVSVMEFIFAKDESPTPDDFPQKAIALLSKYENLSSYILKYNVEIAFDSEKEGNYSISFVANSEPNLRYREFFIKDNVLPYAVDFDIIWGYKNTNNKSKETITKKFSKVPFNSNNKAQKDISFDTSSDFKPILIENITFHYSEQQEKTLRQRIELIDEYYKEATQIDYFLRELEAIQKNKPSSEEEIEKAIQKIEAATNTIQRQEEYTAQLVTEKENAITLRRKLRTLKAAKAQARVTVFPKQDSPSCQSNYEKALKQLEEGKTNLAKLSLGKVLEECPTHVMALIQRGQILYRDGEFENARQDLTILSQMEKLNTFLEENKELKTTLESVYYDLYAFFVRKGEQTAKDLEFEEALDFYDQAKEICSQTDLIKDCEKDLTTPLDKLRKNQLEYLNVQTKNALYEDDLETALLFIEKLKATEKTESSETLKSMKELKQKLEKRADDALNIQNWEDVVAILELKAKARTNSNSESKEYWSEIGKELTKRNNKELLMYAALRYSQLDINLTNSLFNQLSELEASLEDWQRLGRELGNKDYYLYPQSNAKEKVKNYKIAKKGSKEAFETAYLGVWEE